LEIRVCTTMTTETLNTAQQPTECAEIFLHEGALTVNCLYAAFTLNFILYLRCASLLLAATDGYLLFCSHLINVYFYRASA